MKKYYIEGSNAQKNCYEDGLSSFLYYRTFFLDHDENVRKIPVMSIPCICYDEEKVFKTEYVKYNDYNQYFETELMFFYFATYTEYDNYLHWNKYIY